MVIRLKLRILEGDYLLEDIAAVKKYYPKIDDDVFMTLIALDPTYRDGSNSLGKYGKWILNLYNKGKLSEDDFGEVTPLLNQFTTYKNRIQNKDLNAYKTLDDLDAVVSAVVDDDSMLSDRQKLRFKKNLKAGRVENSAQNDYSTDYEDSYWIVQIPHTHEASMKLGKGTSWCTAHEDPEWYNTYTYDDGEEFNLYVMKNKSTGERWQYCDNPYRGYDYQFMDENDNEVEPGYFISDLMSDNPDENEGFVEYLTELNPEFFKNVRIMGENGELQVVDNTIIKCDGYVDSELYIPDGIDEIGEGAFLDNADIDVVVLSDSVRIINESAFETSSINELRVSESSSLEYIDKDAFYGADSLTSIWLPDSLEVINYRAFAQSGVHQAQINNVTLINTFAFQRSDLGSLYIYESRDGLEIRELAFSECPELTKVLLPDNVKSISDKAFDSDNDNLVIYSDSDYVKEYCEKNGIEYGGGYDDM